ncbi:hypothetical protein Q2X70_004208 [Salmonella enterica]|nr:hypothetical protein [Salmonella enterica]EHL9563626.1 hypothetical protein [Salmonella enterica subsp. enterica serovar Altona]EKE3064093.1 hypothetical protein [Salmonella enterica]EKE6392709.1 hypothetical protein [Salmonella enterica]ELM6820038.1 hypothetical protein [Salmonella enterica]
MKLNIKSGLIVLALFTLTACAVDKGQFQQEQALNQTLRKVNQSDREVTRRESEVKIAATTLAAVQAALAKAKQEQQKARTDFESLYGSLYCIHQHQ